MQNFRKLKVWERSHKLALKSYKVTANFPRGEMYGLTSQIRRASSSIPANIAEGCGRGSNSELARFLQISMGSASELQYHILLARDLTFITREEYEYIINEVTGIKRMLTSLIQKLKTEN